MKTLVQWKDKAKRKPMIITGCRQCGKTYLMSEFGKEYFSHTVIINFEKEPGMADIFNVDLNPDRILNEIGIIKEGKPIDTDNTLIIFDEIQECPKAITSLKYFEESEKNLYLLCAGSLLGVEIKRKKVSFPVGKNEQLKLYPLNFYEFTRALGGGKYLDLLEQYDLFREIPSLITEPMLHYLKLYYIIGGMPGAVQAYLDTEDISEVEKIQDQIIQDYQNDFSHHAEPKDVLRIGWIWESIPKQLAKDNNKFVFSHVKEGTRARDLEDALQWLVDAGLVYRLEKVSVPQIPLSACSDATFFKVYLHDVGILRRIAGISYRTVLNEPDEYTTFKGAFTENYCMTELVALGIRPYYWKNDNSAEVDFIFEDEWNRVIPMEAKSAERTRAKSFSVFCKRFSPVKGFKVSSKNIGDNQKGSTHEISLPLYLMWKLQEYID